jgi:hypothetical protein
MVNCDFFSSSDSCDVMHIQRKSWIAHYWISVLSFIHIISLSSITEILSIEITNVCLILDRGCLHLILSDDTTVSHFWVSNVCLILEILSCLIFSVVISACPELIIILNFVHILLKLFVLSLVKQWILLS